ncbi:glycosyltransferase family 39 protein [Candidatus Sumerlaeota bacterium]|nr:glycosyltransferase family 39 protein [Candidatus Sumerlaeota bacterium]
MPKQTGKRRLKIEKQDPPRRVESADKFPLAPRGLKTWMLAGALLLATFVAYFPALKAGYIWDDEALTENIVIQQPGGLAKIWLHPSEYREHEEHYWPLVYTSFWIENKVWGLNPAGYHAVNILLHAVNSILIGLILSRGGGRGAWLAAAIFALHPVHVESVAWVMQRKDLLSGFFYLGAFLFYIGYESKHSRLQYILSCLCLIFAMLSKSVAVSLPAALALWVWWRKERLTLRDWFRLSPLFAIAFAMAFADYLWVREHGIDPSGLEWWARPLLAARAVLFYSGKLIVPLKLMAIYPRWTIVPSDAVYAIGLLAILITLYLLRHRIGKAPLAALLFYGLTLAPVLGGLDF